MQVRGFVLQASHRVAGGRTVVLCHGVLEEGGTFLLRDDRERPCLHVHAQAAPVLQRLGLQGQPPPPGPGGRPVHGLGNEPLLRVDLHSPADAPALRERLHGLGVPTFEADLQFARRYLIDRGIRGGCRLEGEARAGTAAEGVDWVFDNPALVPADVTPRLRVLSFDIETTPDASHVLAIALAGAGADEVLLVHRRPEPPPPGAIAFVDERALLQAFMQRVRELDPDVLTGWNVVDFDLAVLERIAQRVRLTMTLGRGPGALRIRRRDGFFQRAEAHVPGRLVLDGIALLQGAFVRMDEYGLDAVARQVLDEGKTITAHGGDKVAEIMRRYVDDRAAFVEYARTDAWLALRILEKLQLVELSVARSQLTGMTPDRVSGSIASFDFLYLGELHRRGILAPSVGSEGGHHEPQAGGWVLDSRPGLYRDVLVFDFKSLYPSIIRTFNLDPLGFRAHATDDCIVAPNGAAFAREPGILPGLLDALFPRREQAKRAGDAIASQAIKILMNSFYGVLGTPACRFHNPAIANAITSFGKLLLLWSKAWFEARGLQVLYGDTDSLFVLANPAPAAAHATGQGEGMRADTLRVEALRAEGAALAAALNAALRDHVQAQWQVPSRLELEFEKHYLRLLLPSVRGGEAGARKRYAGLLATRDGERLEFTGMEVVRRDWTDLAKQVQRELYARLFADADVEDYLRTLVAQVRAGAFDDALVYRKGLRKSLASYTDSTPPHVAAARKLAGDPGRLIAYVMTTAGPEPVSDVRHPLDREHYIERQVRPVAEPVLALRGTSFDRLQGQPRQIDLF
jgi:DNA polymerase-2